MRYYKDDGRDSIESSQPVEIPVEDALAEIEGFPEGAEENFIGFVNDGNENVQFIRHGREQWLVDAPMVEAGKFAYSLQGEATTAEVKEIVRRFAQGGVLARRGPPCSTEVGATGGPGGIRPRTALHRGLPRHGLSSPAFPRSW
jgi:hypothetical protein